MREGNRDSRKTILYLQDVVEIGRCLLVGEPFVLLFEGRLYGYEGVLESDILFVYFNSDLTNLSGICRFNCNF